jgi:succinate dehydrogenase / fumarate reductase flavoprotein subunit/fumarate reductase flavoprotein subunit
MGGAVIDTNGKAGLENLFVAGEDSGGVHGANRLGGNGICDSCVYGRQTGKAVAKYLANGKRTTPETRRGQVEEIMALLRQPLTRATGINPFELRKQIQELNWNKVGVARNAADLKAALAEIDSLAAALDQVKVTGGVAYNMMYSTALDLRSMIDVSRLVATSASLRDETRGAHFRQDFPEQRDDYGLFNIFLQRAANGALEAHKKPVQFKYKSLAECQKYKKESGKQQAVGNK